MAPACKGNRSPRNPRRPSIDWMKQTSWLSGFPAVRSPIRAAWARTSALVSVPTGKRTWTSSAWVSIDST